jgi:hypothetical protein
MILDGSDRGPVALPVFKIGCCLLTVAGWVRLPGASASLLSQACVNHLVVSQIGFAQGLA